MTAADKIAEARALIEPLQATVLWGNANPNVTKAAEALAALADLADAQAQENARLREALNRIADFGPSRRHNQNRNDLIACAAVDIAIAALGDAP